MMTMKKILVITLCLLEFCLSGCAQPVLPSDGFVPEKQIRLIALANPTGGGEWMLTTKRGVAKDYTAQDVLEMIADLKPTCLERFITGYHDADRLVPVRNGYPKMTVLEFLNAAMAAGGPNCRIVPKLNLKWLLTEKASAKFWDYAQKLYDMPLDNPIRELNLDVWNEYCANTTAEQRSEMFKRLRKMGYTRLGVNMTGSKNINDPEIDYADFCINKEDWTVRSQAVEKISSYPNIKDLYLYIDYPNPMSYFMSMTPDMQASVYYNEIYPSQYKYKITYVYAILQDSWDATMSVTSKDGPYGGKSMYDITKELLNKAYEQ